MRLPIPAFLLGICLGLSAPAHALIVGANGAITDWGLTPFSLANQSNTLSGGIYRTISNNYSPIDYPSGIHHSPSGGEAYDLEEMHARVQGNSLQVLIVASSGYVAGGSYKRGDLMLNFNGQQYGIVTQSANQGLIAGSIYELNSASDWLALDSISGSYLGVNTLVANDYGPSATVRDIAGGWAVKGDINVNQKLASAATIATAVHNYGGAENSTHLFEYNIDLSGLMAGDILYSLSQTWGCGNDVIKLNGQTPTPQFIPPSEVPSPASASLVLPMLVMLPLRRSRSRRS